MRSAHRFAQLVGRWAAPAGAAAAAAAICVACSSSTSGSPNTSAPAASGLPSLSVSVPAVSDLPSLSGLPSFSGLPSIGGSEADSAFCKDFTDIDPSSITSDPSQALALYDKLAADAPAEIKPDVNKIRDFLHAAMSGDTSADSSGFTEAVTNLANYYASHCVGG